MKFIYLLILLLTMLMFVGCASDKPEPKKKEVDWVKIKEAVMLKYKGKKTKTNQEFAELVEWVVQEVNKQIKAEGIITVEDLKEKPDPEPIRMKIFD